MSWVTRLDSSMPWPGTTGIGTWLFYLKMWRYVGKASCKSPQFINFTAATPARQFCHKEPRKQWQLRLASWHGKYYALWRNKVVHLNRISKHIKVIHFSLLLWEMKCKSNYPLKKFGRVKDRITNQAGQNCPKRLFRFPNAWENWSCLRNHPSHLMLRNLFERWNLKKLMRNKQLEMRYQITRCLLERWFQYVLKFC